MNAVDTLLELNEAAGDFLLTDAQIAETLLRDADYRMHGPARERHIAQAREALHTIERFLAKLALDAKQRSAIEQARDRLRHRLETARAAGTQSSAVRGVRTGAWPYPEAKPRELPPSKRP